METKIRNAVATDAAVIHRFIVDLARYEREPDAVKNTVDNLRRQMSGPNPPFQCLIAEVNEQPVGFALYFFTYSTWEGTQTLYLEDLYVQPASRGENIGTSILSALARVARAHQCSRMEWSVLNWNQLAIDVYEKIKAEAQVEWTGYRICGDALNELANH
jgi:GNAT superfamily N-acetyltransferase